MKKRQNFFFNFNDEHTEREEHNIRCSKVGNFKLFEWIKRILSGLEAELDLELNDSIPSRFSRLGDLMNE
ncbi:hypothetical protein [Paenibacillus sp. IITD108]|uniref:hypothetical protein n=1 Tax=Paenibacillus sp. IITD108 TaxID=3116649 RepID=UPI002F40F9E3